MRLTRNQKLLAISASAILFIGVTVSATKLINSSDRGYEIPSKPDNVIGEDEKKEIAKNAPADALFYRVSIDGEIIKEGLNLKKNTDIKDYVQYVFDRYSEYDENEILFFPEKVQVLDISYGMGVVYINLSKEIKDVVMATREIEEAFLDCFGKTLRSYKKSNGFRDYQLLVEGERDSRIFNFAETDYPRVIIDEE